MLEYFFSYDQMTYSLGISVSMLSVRKETKRQKSRAQREYVSGIPIWDYLLV